VNIDMKEQKIKLIECPRDAMQGLETFIPTDQKVAYIQQLMRVGFDIVDFGSFVSPKAIPQLRDTEEVLDRLDKSQSFTELLAIVANFRGAKKACSLPKIDYVGFPFSISETFQLRNTNATIEESFELILEIQNEVLKKDKKLVLYLSMGFGNPYGDPWNADIVIRWIEKLSKHDISIFALSDTIGVSTPESISYLFGVLIPDLPQIEIGAHFHSTPMNWKEKFTAALEAGCMRFDGAIKGYGGCPMAKDELTGNMAMENMLHYLQENAYDLKVDEAAFKKAMQMAVNTFPAH
jgi:hydroxymethylglutaryl-CoA lyase